MSPPKASGSPVGVRQVAEHLGVSIATVSRAFKPESAVRPETRARVLEAAHHLGYEPSALGRNLVRGRSFLVGLIVPNIAAPLYGAMTRGVEEVLGESGMRTLLASSLDDPQRERRAAHALLGHAIDAGIVINSGALEPLPSRRGSAWVHIAPEHAEHTHRVELDNVEGGRLAAQHLLAAGHRQLAFLGSRGRESREREQGFAQALAGAGLGYRRTEGDYSEASGAARTRELLESGPLDALFVGGDRMAAGVLRALRSSGRRVPQDVSVIGFDDAEFSSLLDPPLTTVRQPAQAMGRAAAEMVLALLERQHCSARLFLPTLVERDSARPPARASPRAAPLPTLT